MIKNAAFYRNLARLRRVASRKIDTDFATVNGDKVHRGQFGMRQIANLLCESETLEHRPARWVQTIAAHLFSGKSFPLENKRVQSSQGTTCCTGRSGRAAPHDRHVKGFHLGSTCDQRSAFPFTDHGSLITFIARMSMPPNPH